MLPIDRKRGNVLQYGLTAFTYDGASRVRTAGGVCYVYNAEGIRTAKGTWNGTSCANIASQYILGRGGEQVTELVGLTGYVVWQHTNVGAGNLMATYDAQGLHFNFTDWLGTKRAQVNADGTIEQTCLSLPFGDALSCDGTGTDATEHHFTGKERDVESGLDYFGARYFASDMGRWMSPDWAAKVAPVPYARMDDPQSLNLYAYVGNNPLSMADADGHQSIGDCAAGADACQKTAKGRAKSDAAEKEKAKEKAQPAQQQAAPTNLTVVITAGVYGGFTSNDHAGMVVTGNGDTITYDPGGAYQQDAKPRSGAGGVLSEEADGATLAGYLAYERKNSLYITTYSFSLSADDAATISKRLTDGNPGNIPFLCATDVASALRGVGPFRDLPSDHRPSVLGRDLGDIKGVSITSYIGTN